MPFIWSYADNADRGYGIFKSNVFKVLEENGWKTRLARIDLLHPNFRTRLLEDLLRSDPDWMLLINQSAQQFYEYLNIPSQYLPLRQKKLIWYLDDPHFFVDRTFERDEIVLCFDETYLEYLQSWQPAAVIFLPLAADMESGGEYREEFACDVCFVGGVIDQSGRRSQLNETMQKYVDHLVELKLQQRDKDFYELAAENPIAPGKGITITPPVAHYLYWEANNRYRVQTLEALQNYDLRIYGNEDWQVVLQHSPLQEKFYGSAHPVHDLPHIFSSARVNLNLHSVQCMGSLNQRDFNAPLAGGFLLSDWTPAAGKYFIPGKEAIYWSQIDDLKAKIEYYLNHRDERLEVIRQGRERVLWEHTYGMRVSRLLDILQSGVTD
ncbi:MAG: CgeB family protein [bacterium]